MAADYGVPWAFPIFCAGIALTIIAQIIAYLTGPRRPMRRWGLACGIVAVLLIGAAGAIVNSHLTEVAAHALLMNGGS